MSLPEPGSVIAGQTSRTLIEVAMSELDLAAAGNPEAEDVLNAQRATFAHLGRAMGVLSFLAYRYFRLVVEETDKTARDTFKEAFEGGLATGMGVTTMMSDPV